MDAANTIRLHPTPLPLPPLILKAEVKRWDLPEFDNAHTLLTNTQLNVPDELIQGVLHKGTKGIIASTSKAGKTWLLLDLAISVATGTKFLKWDTMPGRVLFVNFEIQRTFIKERLKILHPRKTAQNLDQLDIWTLRGHSADFMAVLEELIRRVSEGGHSLIIIDPIYKAMTGTSENVGSGVSVLCHNIDQVVADTGASVIYAHHFTKGNQAKKTVLDRMSGSGVFARDADSIITLTPHAEENCHTVELTLRNFPQHTPFVVQWQYPLMQERPDLDPADIGSGGKPEDETADLILDLLADTPLSTTDWEQAAKNHGIPRATFYRTIREIKAEGRACSSDGGKTWQSAADPDETAYINIAASPALPTGQVSSIKPDGCDT